ncbi:hypothetical protein [Natrinema sp. DC36]|uniref:hypothetical protein n=1 Tax=Natrinema sp. DC36 TaxID=2878680 RepID=UPI001CF0BB0A|nr:hypothetical protein [Natrinema sp. DC36]
MAADERPTPPPELDRVDREALEEFTKRDAATLREVSAYLEEVAAWKERREGADDESISDEADAEPYPDGVPERATVSVTEIAGTEYDYYQWREGDEIRSETVRR